MSGAGDGYYEIGFDGRKHWGPWNPVGRSFAEKDGLRLHDRLGGLEPRSLIQSVDVDADGRFIAVAEKALLPFGSLLGTVYVIDIETRCEVFRRYLKKGSRAVVQLPGRGFFGYSDEADDSIGVFALPR